METTQLTTSLSRCFMIPMSSVKDIPMILGELFAKFQTSFYADPVDAVFNALGGGIEGNRSSDL